MSQFYFGVRDVFLMKRRHCHLAIFSLELLLHDKWPMPSLAREHRRLRAYSSSNEKRCIVLDVDRSCSNSSHIHPHVSNLHEYLVNTRIVPRDIDMRLRYRRGDLDLCMGNGLHGSTCAVPGRVE